MLRQVLQSKTKSEMVTELIMSLLTLLLSTILLRLMWNKSLAKHVSILKPIGSLGDAFLLSVSLAAIRGC